MRSVAFRQVSSRPSMFEVRLRRLKSPPKAQLKYRRRFLLQHCGNHLDGGIRDRMQSVTFRLTQIPSISDTEV